MARRSKSSPASRNGKRAAKPAPTRPAAARGKAGAARPAAKKPARNAPAERKLAAARKAPAARQPPADRKPAAARRRATPVTPVEKPLAAKRRARAVSTSSAAEVPTPTRRPAAPRRSRAVSAQPEPPAPPAEDESRTAPAEDVVALPETYGRTRVRLLMQSPGRLFVHWDLSPGVVEELRGQIGRRAASLARLAVRIAAPGNARPLIVLLPRGARTWYVDVPPQRLEYRAELGLMLPSGEFRVLAASNPVRIPRTTPSPVPAGRRVSFARGQAPGAEAMGELPSDEATEEELGADGGPDAATTAVPTGDTGGSSELSGRGTRTRPQPDRGLGSASDLGPGGSSSDLRRR